MSWLQGVGETGHAGGTSCPFSPFHGESGGVARARFATVRRRCADVVPLFGPAPTSPPPTPCSPYWVTLPSTRDWLDGTGRQVEVMLGYSDSAKDVRAATATTHPAEGTGSDGRLGTRERRHPDDVPRPQGLIRPQRQSMHWGRDRPATGQRRQPSQGDRAGRGGVRGYADTTIAQRHLERLHDGGSPGGTAEVE